MAFKFDGLALNWVHLILVEFKFGGVAAQSCDIIKSTMVVYPLLVIIVASRNFVLCERVHVLVRP